MQINCAKAGRTGPSHVGRSLQDIKLCSQSSSKIAFRDVERLICCLNVVCLGFEYPFGLLKIKKSAAHLRGNSAPGRPQCLHSGFASGARGLHASFGGIPVKYVPRCVYSYHTAIVKFGTDTWIALAVNLVPGESPDMWPQCTPVQNILLVFDLDVLLPSFDHGSIRISSG